MYKLSNLYYLKTTLEQPNKRTCMKFLESAYKDIIRSVGFNPCETGGILLGTTNDFIVQKFCYDFGGKTWSSGYNPDINYLTPILRDEEKTGLKFIGFLHSHPRGVSTLTGDWGNVCGDLGFIKEIFEKNPRLEKFLVPIVFSSYDGGEFKIFPYIAYRNSMETPKLAELKVINNRKSGLSIPIDTEFTFSPEKLEGSVDYELLKNSHITCVGIGGANTICESLVRSGLGKLTVIDFDVVDKNNLVTQGFYKTDIGRPKEDALKERLYNINPKLEYNGINADFTKLPQDKIKKIANRSDLLLMMTDDFYTQAFGNMVALKYRLPAIFAIMYEKARCSEITFSIPGITPACHRCATSSRYKAYEEGYKNDVTSTGSTNFHTQYLNSLIGLLALAILHRNTTGLEFSNWFGNRWEQNLIQLRTHPGYGTSENSLFNRTFKGIDRVFNFDSVWHKVKVKKSCLDCFGFGDLNTSAEIIIPFIKEFENI